MKSETESQYDAFVKRLGELADRAFKQFRRMQTDPDSDAKNFANAKQTLREHLRSLDDELNRRLAKEYGVRLPSSSGRGTKGEGDGYAKWLKSHQPFHWFVEFYGIMQNGGFDVIIGNPPYVEYAKIKKDYTINNYSTVQSANLYAFTSERSLNILNKQGSFGFIVPISSVCTQRMKAMQDKIFASAHSAWFSDYAERPSKLFEGAEVLLTIVITRGSGQGDKMQFTTGFTKWASEERPCLFERLSYYQAKDKPKNYVIPKLSGQTEMSILGKMFKNVGTLARHFQKSSKHLVYYRIGGGRYWKVFTKFQPRFVLNGKAAISSRENYLYLPAESFCDTTISVLSSSLFYWYFILTTNCRDLTPSDLNDFPINLDSMTSQNTAFLGQLCKELMEDYKNKSQLKEKTSRLTGAIIYEEFYPRLSKPIIDQIDQVLAKHYGFTDEELDFIINYDIKYRMGRTAGDEEETPLSANLLG